MEEKKERGQGVKGRDNIKREEIRISRREGIEFKREDRKEEERKRDRESEIYNIETRLRFERVNKYNVNIIMSMNSFNVEEYITPLCTESHQGVAEIYI